MKVLITAGPTREYIDPVRFISNRSSGKMGYALAEAALRMNHDVYLISGPVSIKSPPGAEIQYVETAHEMSNAVKNVFANADLIIMAAAVADYRPLSPAENKIKKSAGKYTLELEATEDILMYIGNQKTSGRILCGFAAETENSEENALAKLYRKNLDWIALNDVSLKNSGFESEYNSIRLISSNSEKYHFSGKKKNIAIDMMKVLTKSNSR